MRRFIFFAVAAAIILAAVAGAADGGGTSVLAQTAPRQPRLTVFETFERDV